MTRGSSRMQIVVLLALCAVVAALGLVNWWVIGLEPELPSAAAGTAPGAPATPVPGPRPVDDRPLSDFAEILRRPLFTSSRSPFPARAEPSRLPSDIRLTGIAIDASKKQALLRTPQQPQGRWVEEGHSIDGWLLRSVRDDAVILASGQQTRELRLYPTQGPSPGQQ
jgi:hypothetical protein